MKNQKRIYYLFYLIWTFLPAHHLGAQEKGAWQVTADSLINPPLLKGGEQIVRFDSSHIHIGTLWDNDTPRQYTFLFRNVSSDEIRITRVTTSCGCTAAIFTSGTIAPGAEDKVILTYNPKDRIGTVETHAFVYTTVSRIHPIVRLTLIGEVLCSDVWGYLPYRTGTLRMKRKRVVFSEITPRSRPSERILCANTGEKPMTLSVRMLPSYARFHSEPETILPGKEGDLVITVEGNKLVGQVGEQLRFSFALEGVDAPIQERLVNVIVNRVQE